MIPYGCVKVCCLDDALCDRNHRYMHRHKCIYKYMYSVAVLGASICDGALTSCAGARAPAAPALATGLALGQLERKINRFLFTFYTIQVLRESWLLGIEYQRDKQAMQSGRTVFSSQEAGLPHSWKLTQDLRVS